MTTKTFSSMLEYTFAPLFIILEFLFFASCLKIDTNTITNEDFQYNINGRFNKSNVG